MLPGLEGYCMTMVCTLVLAVGMHGKWLVTRFSDYHGNSSFALQVPPTRLVNPPLLFVVFGTGQCAQDLLSARLHEHVSKQFLLWMHLVVYYRHTTQR